MPDVTIGYGMPFDLIDLKIFLDHTYPKICIFVKCSHIVCLVNKNILI